MSERRRFDKLRGHAAGPHVAVIGAGISGLTCASELHARGLAVRVFDKGRGPGGRMSTRRALGLRGRVDFDHGAQYFTARGPELLARMESWTRAGVVAEWPARIEVIGPRRSETAETEVRRFVGTPTMSSICRHLARDIDVRSGVRVAAIERQSQAWGLCSGDGESLASYDVVVVTVPSPQAVPLLARVAPDLAERASNVSMDPCWALLAAFETPLPLDFDAAFVNQGPLRWIARTSSKPDRAPHPDRWVVHASPDWSREHLEGARETMVQALLDAFFASTGLAARTPVWARAHRWRHALAAHPLPDGFLWDERRAVAACGDWTNGNRVEGAFVSGLRCAEAIARTC